MADLRYSAEIDVRNAQRSLDNLKQAVFDVGAAIAGAFAVQEITTIAGNFENLRTTLQILYKDTAIGAKAFEEIKKFAEESVFSVEDLTNTVVKLKTAGIQPTVALLKMFADTSSVAADSVGALNAITDLYARTTAGGLGLEDLNRLADRGIPVFQILADKLGLSRLEISKIGGTAEGAQLILRALESGLNDAFGGASQARLGTVNQSISAFKDSLANAADAIGQAGLNKGVSELAASMTKLVTSARPIIELIGKGLGGALKIVADNLRVIIILVGGLITVLAVSWIGRAVSGFLLLARAIGASYKSLVLFAGGAVAASEGLSEVEKAIKATEEKISGLNNNVIVDGKLSDGTEDYRSQVARLNQELNKFKAEMLGVTSEFERYNKNIVRQINLDSELISQSKLVQDIERSRNELYKRSQDEIAKLRIAKSKLTEEEKKQGRAGIIDATIAAIQRQTKEDDKSIISAISRKNQEEIANNAIVAGRQRVYDISRQINDLKFDGATMGLSNLDKQLSSITKSADDWAKSTIQGLANAQNISVEAFQQLYPEQVTKVYKAAAQGLAELTAQARLNNTEAERVRDLQTSMNRVFDTSIQLTQAITEAESMFMDPLSKKMRAFDNEAEFYLRRRIRQYDIDRFGIDKVAQGFSIANKEISKGGDPKVLQFLTAESLANLNDLKDITQTHYELSRTWHTGWHTAFSEYVSDAENAAKRTERVFRLATRGMEDALVGFAKTGKFEWRNFVNSMLEELLRSQIRLAFGNILKGVNNDISIARAAAANGQTSGGVSGFLSNLFGGFFANGGTLGAGKFGIVGERGPELISGPATITPITAGGNVTYNINAVDAMSFKALIASDPAFIHAVATQGGRSIPGRR